MGVTAISGIEHALWVQKGKHCNVPIWRGSAAILAEDN